MEVLLVAVKKDKLAEYTNLITEAGLNPVVVDVDAFSLENMYAANYDLRENEVVSLVNIGTNGITINVLKGGAFSFTRDIALGSYKCTEAIQRDFHVNYDEAVKAQRLEAVEGVEKEAVLGIIDHLNIEIATEVARSLDYFKTTSNQTQIHRILLTGGAAKLPNLLPRMEEKTGTTVEIANPFNRIELPSKGLDLGFVREMAPVAAVGVGLAMRRIGDR
jgi:type IV pilus assembly protein PilM